MPRKPVVPVLLAACLFAFAGGVLPGAPTTVAAWAQAAGRKIDLRPKFTKGQEIRLKLELTNRNRTGAAAPGTPGTPGTPGKGKEDDASQSIHQEYVLLLKVKGTNPETGSTLELVYEQVKLRLKTPTGDLDFDSSKPKKDDPMDEMLRPMVGTSLTVELDNKGNVKSVTGGDALSDAVGGGLAGSTTGSGALKDMFGNVMNFSPTTGQASVGESWSVDSKMEAPGGTWTLKATNTLRSASGGKADIDIKGKLTLDPATSGRGQGVTVKDARYNGKAVWNTERGMIESMETQMRVESRDKGGEAHVGEATMKVTRMK